MIAIVPIHFVQPQWNRILPILGKAAILPIDVVLQVQPRRQMMFASDTRLRIVQLQLHRRNLGVRFAFRRGQGSAESLQGLRFLRLKRAQ
ncbi:MAG: hypothetical protein WDO18_13025 [Acidobacteriota bacterium]